MADFENYSMFEDGKCSYTSDEVEFNESPYDTDEDFNSEEQCSEYLSKDKGINGIKNQLLIMDADQALMCYMNNPE